MSGADHGKEVLARVQASPGRRFLGIGSLALLAFLVLYVAFVQPPALGWQVFLVALGAVALWMAERMRQATAMELELTETELRDSSGAVLARVADIAAMDRGMFAFKPSNGFLLTLKSRGSRVWHPGLWWRFGRRIGIGGMTPGAQTKFMAEMISAMIVSRGDDVRDDG